MTQEQIDSALREMGYDPKRLAMQGKVLAEILIKNRELVEEAERLRSQLDNAQRKGDVCGICWTISDEPTPGGERCLCCWLKADNASLRRIEEAAKEVTDCLKSDLAQIWVKYDSPTAANADLRAALRKLIALAALSLPPSSEAKP